MLNVLANSFMIASRAPGTVFRPKAARLATDETARARRSREITAFIAASRDGADRHMNA